MNKFPVKDDVAEQKLSGTNQKTLLPLVARETKGHYKQLDGLRALAVTGVMLSHWIFSRFFLNIGAGFLGVILFFVLSGFLITEILFNQIGTEKTPKIILRNFYAKRILRIFPVYYFIIALLYACNFEHVRYLAGYAATFTFNIYNATTGDPGGSISHFWSLCVEEQFYLLWPFFLVFIKPAYHFRLIVSMIIAAVAFRFVTCEINLKNHIVYNYRMMPACLDAVGLGALLAYAKRNHRSALRSVLKLWVLPVAAFLVYLYSEFSTAKDYEFIMETIRGLLVSIVSFFLVGKAVFGIKNPFGNFLILPPVRYLGKISYGLYLYHPILFGILNKSLTDFLVAKVVPSLPKIFSYNLYLLTAPVFFFLTVLMASFSYHLIEQPFLQWKAKIAT